MYYKDYGKYLLGKGYQYHSNTPDNYTYFTLLIPNKTNLSIENYNDFFSINRIIYSLLKQTNHNNLNTLINLNNNKIELLKGLTEVIYEYPFDGTAPFYYGIYTFGEETFFTNFCEEYFVDESPIITQISLGKEWKGFIEDGEFIESLTHNHKESLKKIMIGFIFKM